MKPDDFDTFLALAEALKAAGWAIQKFENLGGGVTLTIIPIDGRKEKNQEFLEK